MDHDGARRLMAQAMEGSLESDDERDLALHLVACEDCKDIYEGLQHANPALTSIQLGEPSTEALDAAVRRATTVLRGEADPGPMGLSEEAPGLPDELDPNTVRIDSGVSFMDQDELQPAGPFMATGPLTPPSGAVRRVETHVRPIESEPELDIPEPELPPDVAHEGPEIGPDLGQEIGEVPAIGGDEPYEPPPLVADLPPLQPITVEAEASGFGGNTDDDAPLLAPEVVSRPPVITDQPIDVPVGAGAIDPPRSEIETLLEEDRTRFEPLQYEDDDGDPPNARLWLLAAVVTIVLAVAAGVLIFRGGSLFGGGGGDLPDADQVRSRVASVFTEMKSLKSSFEIQKLSLYRVGRTEDSLRYSFSTGRWQGRINYDRAEGNRQTFTLNVRQEEVERADIVQKSNETVSLLGSGDAQSFTRETNPPLGPPDGALRPNLGLLEDSLGSAAALIADATELEVLRQTESEDGRPLFEIRATVPATELSRADRIEAALDGNNFLPVIVKRSISRQNARILGPESALTNQNLDTAFGDNDRITTELVELSDVRYDEVVLPGDLQLEAPDGVEEQKVDSRFERITRPELGAKLEYEPLLPRGLGEAWEEQRFAHATGDPKAWGPGNALPEPESVFHAQYFDGRTTVVITQRRMAERFNVDGSPLARGGLPITVERLERDTKEFFYGTSPEVPPHVYGWLGNTFVIASGYASQDELLRIVTSLAETAVDVPPIGSPGPTGSPGATGSPSASGSPTVTATPATTLDPIGSP